MTDADVRHKEGRTDVKVEIVMQIRILLRFCLKSAVILLSICSDFTENLLTKTDIVIRTLTSQNEGEKL